MLPNAQHSLVFAPVSKTNGATASGSVDTLGYDFAEIVLTQGTSNDATNNLSVCRIAQGEDTVLTNATNVTALVGDGAGGFTIPNADASNEQIYVFRIDLRTVRSRYLHLVASPVTTQILGATARLSRAKESVEAAAGDVALLVEV